MAEDVREFMAGVEALGIRLFLEEGRLQCRGEQVRLTPALLEQVRERRDAIVAHLRAGAGAAQGGPLTAGQRSLLLHQRLTPDSVAYNLALVARTDEALDAGRLDRALRSVMTRHAILRTTYRWNDGEPLRCVAEVPAAVLVEETAAAEAAESLAEAFVDRPFDLERELPLRAALVRGGPDDARPVLALAVHHIAADLRSVDVIVEEWLAAYRAEDTEETMPHGVDFAEQTRREQQRLAGPGAADALAFWREELAGLEEAELPFDRPRPPVQTFRGGRHTVQLDHRLSAAIGRVAREADATPNMLFLSAFQVLLQKYLGADDVVVGTPAANRPTADVRDTVGFFADPVVVRTRLADDPTFLAALGRTRGTLLRALDHPFPFPLLVERLNPVRDPRRSPFFQVMYVWQQTDPDRQPVPLTPLAASGQRGAPYDLVLSVQQVHGRFACSWTYNVDLFDRATVERIADGYLALLDAVTARPERRVSQLPALSREAERELRAETSGPTVDLGELSWLDQFDAQVRRTPGAVALVCGERSVTYRELGDRVDGMAAALRARGVREEVRVGLCAERSVELVVAMLAVVRAGGAYLPLDPDYPAERLAHMAEDGGIALCLVDRTGERAVRGCPGERVALDTLAREAAGLAPTPLAATPEAALAYVIYTSGSTGRPKGVMVTRRNVTNLFAGLDLAVGAPPTGAPPTGEQPVWLAVTSVCFDISVVELLWTLCRGYRVIVETERWAAPARRAGANGSAPARPVDFSLFYFASDSGERRGSDVYRMLLEGARFADAAGLRAVWLPERHFHAFGGAFPNPSVLAAAVAAVTERVALRAGSVVLPLQDPLRVAEEWAAVDNLSDGRVGLSFASGWQPDDFVLAPEKFADRKERMWRDIETVRALWRGESVRRVNGVGAEVETATLPRPVQPELPVWATAAGSEETFRQAGAAGANLLTHLLGQNVHELARKIGVYRAARAAAGHDEGVVTLMLHTFVHPDPDVVQEAVREPFKNYLRSSIDLMRGLAKGLGLDPVEHRELLVDHAYQRFANSSALFGTPEHCASLVRELADAGVDEIACLIDFGVDDEQALAALDHVVTVRRLLTEASATLLADTLSRHGVTHLQCTPAYARMLLETAGTGAGFGPLRHLLVGGDAALPELVERLGGSGVERMLNMYGPTETTVWSAVRTLEVDASGRVTVGGALANTTLYVLDRHLRPVPPGVVGELFVGGTGVARGYWDRPALTAERFLPDPFATAAGARMYRTGDLVRSLGGGRLEFLGRVDHQIKVRGFRVEAGEIEAVLGAHPDVAECAVSARRDGAGDSSLIAFVVPRGDAGCDEQALRSHVRGLLPEYMVPSRFVARDALPLTQNGKTDRGALVRSATEVSSAVPAGYVGPRDEAEGALQRIWAELLERDSVGVHENFFEVGGHSVLAARLHSRIQDTGLGPVELVDIFTYPTIAALAARLGSGGTVDAERGRVDDRVNKQRAAVRRQQRRRQSS
ncbi:MupA/Atu3671 family FMN-dependent luciferase-like monooxygenase [Streptomyces sp. NBC_00358]|uniref:MupA/Atu3671 family FMN-dependent luciferase-like monooxygenase n=1 Tax=Streptomyces sp. NBC_00358 TaxID=2975725 RepID=UPI002E260B7A